MTRNLKALVLALATALAFAALASAASASTHHFTGKSGTSVGVTGNTPQIFTPTTGGNEGFICNRISVAGSLPADTGDEVTVAPTYSECKTEGALEATVKVDPMGCTYTLFGTTTTGNPTGNEHANVAVNCTGTNEITVLVTGLNLKCTAVPPQLIKHAVRYVDLGSNEIKVEATAHGFTSTTEGSCKGKESPEEIEGKQTHTNGSYTGTVTISGATLTTNATP